MTTDNRKFYKTVFTVTVLSEEPISRITLGGLAHNTEYGDWSGDFSQSGSEELSGPEMATALLDQGSDPSFFQLNEDGTELDEDNYDPLCPNQE